MYCFEFFFLSFYWNVKRIRLYRACDSLMKINIIFSYLRVGVKRLLIVAKKAQVTPISNNWFAIKGIDFL